MSTSRTPRAGVLGLTVGALVAGGLVLAPAASAVSPDVVINEVYGGGGNSGATYTNDFIELQNNGSTPVSVTGWSVQYGSSGGSTWATTPLSGTIAPGGRYLVQEAAGTGGTTPLPGPNSVGTIAMSGTSGKVALVTSTATLTCATDCDKAPGVRDFLGYGAANDYEGDAPAQALTNTTSSARNGTVDHDQNGTDFTRGAPTPNSTGVSEDPPPPPKCASEGVIPIADVQGSGASTPCPSEKVTVEGIVVGDLQESGFNGFFVQDSGDEDPATSDGIFVYAPGGTAVAPGDRVTVTGTAGEFNGATQLGDATYSVASSGALPAATPLALPSTGTEREAQEGMLVAPAENLTVTELFNLTNFGEVLLAQGGRLINPTEIAEPGPDARALAEENARRSIVLDDGLTTDLSPFGQPLLQPPYLTLDDPIRVGDTAVLEPVVLHYAFGSYRLEPSDGTADGMTFTATNPRPATPDEVGGDLRIADFNVLNYFVDFPSEFGDNARGAENAEELAQQQAKIVTAITALDADVIALHEIENSAILTPETPYRALETLVAALNEAQGRDTWRFVRAHEASDVITNAIIYRVNAAQPVGEPMKPAEDAVWDNAREPIAQTFRSRGEVFTIIANHFKSKGSGSGANADTGDGQGASNPDRVAQATSLVAFAAEVAAAAGDPDVLLTGDFNAYRMEDPIDVITAAGFTEVFTPGEYSYVFQGTSGSLDHVFASPSMLAKVTGETIWDINAVESFAYEYGGVEELFAPYAFRASDHNPTLVGVDTKAGTPAAGRGRR